MPMYFRGGRKVGTVRSRKVGGKVDGELVAWRTIAALTARWLMWPDIPPASKVMISELC
jgi:hypothetical protein